MTNTWQEDLHWYETHHDTSDIGFNPDGMCLKICRTSRAIASRYGTAKEAQDATPPEFRVYKVSNLRRGMKMFFDDPNDSNTAGHIVTMIGRVRGGNLNSLDDVLVETNSVLSGQLTVVRASYFHILWGDSFQFGAFWLNGVEFDYPGWAHDKRGADVVPQPDTAPRIEAFRQSGNEWDVKILDRAVTLGKRRDVKPKIKAIEDAVDGLPDDIKDTRVTKFKDRFKKDRVLQMDLLNEAVKDGRKTRVKEQRNALRAAIKSVLRH